MKNQERRVLTMGNNRNKGHHDTDYGKRRLESKKEKQIRQAAKKVRRKMHRDEEAARWIGEGVNTRDDIIRKIKAYQIPIKASYEK